MEKYHAANKLLPSRTDKGPKRSLSEINSIIIHTTGYGPGLKRINVLNKNNLAKVGDAYAYRMANVLKYKGHFLIDHVGVIYQFIPLDEVAWHTGSSKRRRLKKAQPYEWWSDRWPELKNPTELPSWEKRSPNKVSVGIDLLAHGNGAVTPEYTDAQYESLAKLIKALCRDLSIPTARANIVGHEDVDPISRGNRRAGWDPGDFDYDRLLSVVKEGELEVEEELEESTWEEFPRPNIIQGPRPVIARPPVSITSIMKDLFRMFWHK